MQNAETVLDVLRERGRRGLPCDELYRQMLNPQLFLLAYGRLYSNKGAMTAGADGKTVDGMSLAKIGRIVDALRHERYRFQPVKRVYIPKRNGKTRPLGLPSWTDKLVGEVVRLLLEAYYEPRFSVHSHGFRPGRGCHTALREVANTWTGTTWFIEGDIADCFGSLDHEVMLRILSEKIHDNRFLRLIKGMLQAGYLEDWVWHATLSGSPQGGVVSPCLSNIYLDKLDAFVETVLIPQYTRGEARARNPAYVRLNSAQARARRREDRTAVRELRRQKLRLSSGDPDDPGYRRLKYCRYADDHLLGFIGPKAEAEQIKQRLAQFLREELKLELSPDKTLITHARSGAARFLGYEITVQHNNSLTDRGVRRARSTNGAVALRVPQSVVKAKCVPYTSRGKPEARNRLVNDSDHGIVATFGAEYRGLVQYYLLANDVRRLNRVQWVMLTSMLKTLASKHKSTVSKMAARHKTTIETPHGPRRCFEATVERKGRKTLVARFGGIPLRKQKNAVLAERPPIPGTIRGKELLARLLSGQCEVCAQRDVIQVHHVRKLADLTLEPRPPWAQLMAKRRRKTLVVCGSCHDSIHGRQPDTTSRNGHRRAG